MTRMLPIIALLAAPAAANGFRAPTPAASAPIPVAQAMRERLPAGRGGPAADAAPAPAGVAGRPDAPYARPVTATHETTTSAAASRPAWPTLHHPGATLQAAPADGTPR